jgi:hypothetical protein
VYAGWLGTVFKTMVPVSVSLNVLKNKRNPFVIINLFTANSSFQHIFKHSTKICTTNHLSSNLLVLEDGPIKVPKEHPDQFRGRRQTFKFLGLGL